MEKITNLSQLRVGDQLKLVANKQLPLSWFHGWEDVIITVVKICDAEEGEEPSFFFSYEDGDQTIYYEYVEGTYFCAGGWKRNGEVYKTQVKTLKAEEEIKMIDRKFVSYVLSKELVRAQDSRAAINQQLKERRKERDDFEELKAMDVHDKYGYGALISMRTRVIEQREIRLKECESLISALELQIDRFNQELILQVIEGRVKLIADGEVVVDCALAEGAGALGIYLGITTQIGE